MTGGHALDDRTADAEAPCCLCTGLWSIDGCTQRAYPLPLRQRLRHLVTGRRRFHIGWRLTVYVEPRDLWCGIFFGEAAVFVCPVPMLVLRWTRGPRTEWGVLIRRAGAADLELSCVWSRAVAVEFAAQYLAHPSMAGRDATVVYRTGRREPWTEASR